MFMITRNWVMVPQFLYYIFLFGGGLLILVSVGLMVRGIMKRKGKTHLLCQAIVLIVAVLIFMLTLSGKIVGHMMVGGDRMAIGVNAGGIRL